jgi:hypothetical protein
LKLLSVNMGKDKVIVVKKGERCDYTRKGEGLTQIKYMAIAFKYTIKEYVAYCAENKKKKPTSEQILENIKPPELLQSYINDATHKLHHHATQAWNSVKHVYTTDARRKYLKLLIDSGIDIMSCTDDDIYSLLSKKRSAHKESYIRKTCSGIRNIFNEIGRAYPWQDREDVTWAPNDGVHHEFLINAGNPMTSSTEDALKKAAKETSGGASRKIKFLGPAISLPGAVYLKLHALDVLATLVRQPKVSERLRTEATLNVQRINNAARLAMQYCALMHEGARGGDVDSQMTYSNIYFKLHAKVPVLALALLKPSTLKQIIEGNKLTKYAMESFKGKDKQFLVKRTKYVIPYPWNVMDIVTIFTLCTKSMFWGFAYGHHNDQTKIETIGAHIFKNDQTLRSFHKRMAEQVGLKDVVFYSFRYACAAEDKLSSVPEAWTRSRMGHGENSNTKNHYASNPERAVYVSASGKKTVLKLGGEATARPLFANNIKLSYKQDSDYNYETDWITKNLQGEEAQADFRECSELATQYLDVENTEINFTVLLDKFKESHTTVADLHVPLGICLTMPDELTSKSMRKKFKEMKQNVAAAFWNETPPLKPDVEIWSFVHTVYGNWQGLLNAKSPVNLPDRPEPTPNSKRRIGDGNDEDNLHTVKRPKAKQVIDEDEDIMTLVLLPPCKRKKKHVIDEDEDEDMKTHHALAKPPSQPRKRTKKQHFEERATPSSVPQPRRKINAGDFVIIRCNDPNDECTFKIPESNALVWVARAEMYQSSKRLFKGTFYKNNAKDLRKPMKASSSPEEITIVKASMILAVMSSREELVVDKALYDNLVTSTRPASTLQ